MENLRLTLEKESRIRTAKALIDSLYPDVLKARAALNNLSQRDAILSGKLAKAERARAEVESKYEEAHRSWLALQCVVGDW
jgi:cobalamin biosynthesis protein CobD/CbiB